MSAITVLPEQEELSRRLAEADPERAGEALYPGILKMAGRSLGGSGVAVALSLAVAEHVTERGYSQDANATAARYMTLLPNLIGALVDDDEVRADALATLKEARRQQGDS